MDRQLNVADYVLVVCTPDYYSKAKAGPDAPSVRGVRASVEAHPSPLLAEGHGRFRTPSRRAPSRPCGRASCRARGCTGCARKPAPGTRRRRSAPPRSRQPAATATTRCRRRHGRSRSAVTGRPARFANRCLPAAVRHAPAAARRSVRRRQAWPPPGAARGERAAPPGIPRRRRRGPACRRRRQVGIQHGAAGSDRADNAAARRRPFRQGQRLVPFGAAP
jgi:hypothetical protein